MRGAAFALSCALILIVAEASACSIPVFRYALDRWPADRFTLEITAADAKDPDVARFLRNLTDSSPLNLQIERLREDAAEGVTSRLIPPSHGERPPPVWSGKLDGAALPSLTDSPARREIVKRLLAGESAVWVFVSTGKSEADAATAARLEKRLRYLEQIAQLPAIDPNDPSSRLGPGPALRVKFSLLQVGADDPAEKVFLAMLAGPKLDEMGNHGTWAAPVFGRGRVLGAWGAAELGDEQVDELSLFLLGACSCQVKRQNPGWDLLLAVAWQDELEKLGSPPLPDATETKPSPTAAIPSPAARPTPASETPETATFSPASPATSPAPATPQTPAAPLLAGGTVALAAAAALVAWFTRRAP